LLNILFHSLPVTSLQPEDDHNGLIGLRCYTLAVTKSNLLLNQRRNGNMGPFEAHEFEDNRLRVLQLQECASVAVLNRFNPKDRRKSIRVNIRVGSDEWDAFNPTTMLGVAGGAIGVPLMPPTGFALTASTNVLTIVCALIALVKMRLGLAMIAGVMPGGGATRELQKAPDTPGSCH